MLDAARPAVVWPASVTTGTPIHSASHVVVMPLYGSGSRQMSIRSYGAHVFSPPAAFQKFHPIRRDARRLTKFGDPPPMSPAGRLQKQPRFSDGLHYPPPQPEQRLVDFAGIVERSEVGSARRSRGRTSSMSLSGS